MNNVTYKGYEYSYIHTDLLLINKKVNVIWLLHDSPILFLSKNRYLLLLFFFSYCKTKYKYNSEKYKLFRLLLDYWYDI